MRRCQYVLLLYDFLNHVLGNDPPEIRSTLPRKTNHCVYNHWMKKMVCSSKLLVLHLQIPEYSKHSILEISEQAIIAL